MSAPSFQRGDRVRYRICRTDDPRNDVVGCGVVRGYRAERDGRSARYDVLGDDGWPHDVFEYCVSAEGGR